MKVVPITVSFDRTVYPIDSIIYIRFNLKKILENELIHVKIQDSKKRLIIIKQFNPRKGKEIERIAENIFQTSLKMKGTQWRRNNSYTVTAKYDNFEATDSMTVAQRHPYVTTDKSVHIIGSDVIITVISPDHDKDSQKAEIIGNKPGHNLTISSAHGKITNYKLLETGDSTGIFQGLITLIPTNTIKGGKKIRNKSKGTGPINGKLPVKMGEKITVKFVSDSGRTSRVFFSSNFGAAIELDQKTYVPTDKVYLTVIAPDFNYSSNKVDIIGNRADCKLTIKTSIGQLTNYKLSETGKDTGIFTGEICLTSTKNNFPNKSKVDLKKIGITGGKGPSNGKLACKQNDKLVVMLETETGKFVGSALINYSIGEISLDNEYYGINNIAKVRVIDPDMNLNPDKIDTLKIKVWSKTDLEGTMIDLIETDINSGIFEGVVILENKPTKKNRLEVSSNDQIFAKYVDWSLPPPFKSKSLDIIATAKIDYEQPSKRIRILTNSAIPHQGKYLDPETITIEPGIKIRWENEDHAAHTITSGTPLDGPDGKFDSSVFSTGEVFEHVFEQPGEYHYFCMLHPWKEGKIVVKGIEKKSENMIISKR